MMLPLSSGILVFSLDSTFPSLVLLSSHVALSSWSFFIPLLPPPQYKYEGGGDILESLCLSICSPVSVSNSVRISSEPHNHFLPNLVWWCIIMRQCVMQRKKLVHYLQCLGHDEGSYNQNMAIVSIPSKVLVVCNQT